MADLLPAIKKVILEPGSDTTVVIGGEGRQILPIQMSPSEPSP
jgi:hypothetical protein